MVRRDLGVNKLYCFETWSRQLLDFMEYFVGQEPVFVICNSVGGKIPARNQGAKTRYLRLRYSLKQMYTPSYSDVVAACGTAGIAGLQAAVDAPSKVAGVQLLDVSLRMLHTKKQAPWQRPLVSAFQRLLRETPVGKLFFGAIAKPAVSTRFRLEMRRSMHRLTWHKLAQALC